MTSAPFEVPELPSHETVIAVCETFSGMVCYTKNTLWGQVRVTEWCFTGPNSLPLMGSTTAVRAEPFYHPDGTAMSETECDREIMYRTLLPDNPGRTAGKTSQDVLEHHDEHVAHRPVLVAAALLHENHSPNSMRLPDLTSMPGWQSEWSWKMLPKGSQQNRFLFTGPGFMYAGHLVLNRINWIVYLPSHPEPETSIVCSSNREKTLHPVNLLTTGSLIPALFRERWLTSDAPELLMFEQAGYGEVVERMRWEQRITE